MCVVTMAASIRAPPTERGANQEDSDEVGQTSMAAVDVSHTDPKDCSLPFMRQTEEASHQVADEIFMRGRGKTKSAREGREIKTVPLMLNTSSFS